MNKIEEIYTEIQSFYTPMGIEKEIYIMSNLEDMDFNNIELHLSMFYDILQILWDSHGDDYVDVNDSNCKIILSFISIVLFYHIILYFPSFINIMYHLYIS